MAIKGNSKFYFIFIQIFTHIFSTQFLSHVLLKIIVSRNENTEADIIKFYIVLYQLIHAITNLSLLFFSA